MGKMMSSSILISIIFVLLIMEKYTICSLAITNIAFNCIPSERQALLRFKEKFVLSSMNGMPSWEKNNSDCCTWKGVECDNATGHVVGLHTGDEIQGMAIDSSLLELKYLSYLDLSGSILHGASIPTFLGSMKYLQYLNYSNAYMNTGAVLRQLGNLSSLRALDLRRSYRYEPVVDDFMWAINLSSLEYLDMSFVDLNLTKNSFKVLNMLPSLVNLRLSNSALDDRHLPQFNCLNSTLFTNVQYLDLSSNSFGGNLSCFLYNMTSISFLDLSHNSIHANADWISNFMWGKCHLKSLNLCDNRFHGNISRSLVNLSKCASHELEFLDLSQNKLYGHLPDELGELMQLIKLDVSGNNFSGPVPSSLGNLRDLRVLNLSHNQLGGEISNFLGQLSNLESIDMQNNSLEGTLSEAHFDNLSKLEHLSIGTNKMLKFKVRYDWMPPFHQLKYLYLESVEIGGQFPQWIQVLKFLIELDLSNCKISGTLPKWLGTFTNMTKLHLSNNHIEGPIPKLSSNITTLDLSGNVINGSIPKSLCQMKVLEFLDLSKNHLSGDLSRCDWEKLSSLRSARMSSNQLSGPIPNSIGGGGDQCWLQWLQLNNNSFTGQLPSTLQNCASLFVLDVGDNKLSGKLPKWIFRKYPGWLLVLRLRNNKFDGDIPSSYCELSQLQMMDLADNQLTGYIPHCFGNLSGMVKGESLPPDISKIRLDGISLSEVMKGVMMEYTATTSKYLFNLDLSSNSLSGEIPLELTHLTSLNGLNLSHNHLRGTIPQRIGDMNSLESFDLSNNNLVGTIPESLSMLTSLSVLNLSNNNLSGHIPTGPQLHTFNNSIYQGNLELCGDPLPKRCHVKDNEKREIIRDIITDRVYMYAFIFSGLATGLWGCFGVLIFKRSWRVALFRRMDVLITNMLGRY